MYKRQELDGLRTENGKPLRFVVGGSDGLSFSERLEEAVLDSIVYADCPRPVSYTHLVKDAGQTFMATLLFEMMHCGEGLSFSEFRDAFKDGAVTKRKLFFYYLDQDIEQMSLAEAVGCIDRSAYPEGIKHLLISFLIREKDYVQSIAADLAVKDEIVSSYYEENKEILPSICATVSDETLQELTDRKDGEELRYGICLL